MAKDKERVDLAAVFHDKRRDRGLLARCDDEIAARARLFQRGDGKLAAAPWSPAESQNASSVPWARASPTRTLATNR